MEEKATVNITKYMTRTDNKYFPNTKEGWEKFMWQMHFCGGRAIIVAMHYDFLEKRARANAKENS